MSGRWIQRGDSGTTVIFVHGVLSSGETAWQSDGEASWPELVADHHELARVGVRVFDYPSSVFSGSYNLRDAADALKEDLRLEGLFGQQLIFVCHSMGGIVVRKFLVAEAVDLVDSKSTIGLFLVASPSLGSDYAKWLGPLAKAVGHAQADALRFSQTNHWLNDLDTSFTNLKESGRLPIYGKELVEDKFIVLRKFWRKQLVEPFSAARYFGDPLKVGDSDHFTIAKPSSPDAIQHRLLVQFMVDVMARGGNRKAPKERSIETARLSDIKALRLACAS